MTKITDLLDHIDQLDQNATPGPWTAHEDYRGLGGGCVYEPSGYPLPGCFNCGENDAVYEGIDAEFIAEARTALPRLGKALRAVLVLVDEMTQDDTHSNPYVAGVQDMAGTVRHIITTALEADDD